MVNMRISIVILTLFVSAYGEAQNALRFYRSSDNSRYWKKKSPHSSYWQQDVSYHIKAKLDDEKEIIYGSLELTYYNNSPHIQKEAFFHLYQNSFQPESLTDDLYKLNKLNVNYGPYEKQKLGTQISEIKVNGEVLDHKNSNNDPYLGYRVDGTIMQVDLPYHLLPGDSCKFNIVFKTYFDRGSIRRRMKVYEHHGVKHFNGVHWYPRICVFDEKFSWETDEHLEKEFYGDFGEFLVELELPEQYIIEATGSLINEDEVMPESLKKQIDIQNFEGKAIGENPSEIIPPSNKTKTWKYYAFNVHDFAWTADPTYRRHEVKWNGIKCVALAQENNAGRWQETADFLKDVISLYSNVFGLYEYPKIVVADAADGMEYPMLTLCGGYYPSHKSLIAHEVGHNWFMGMLGSNETYRAALDEGFTQFLTAFAMRTLRVESYPEYNRVFAGYLNDAMDGEDAFLNTHSNEFGDGVRHGGGYGHVYYKTATMLYNLKYYLGDSIFFTAMQDYVERWKFCHPYIEDFRNSITASAQTDLTKFFDQWFESNKSVDYAVKKVEDLGDSKYKIHVKRKGEMIMPLDLDLLSTVSKDNKKRIAVTQLRIPVTHFKVPSRSHTEIWKGWNNLRRDFSFEIQLEPSSKLDQVWIDPSGQLADVYRPDNVWRGRRHWSLDWGNGANYSFLGPYHLLYRPTLDFNQYSGLGTGLKLSGQYAARKHVFDIRTYYYWSNSGINGLGINVPAQKIGVDAYWSNEVKKGGRYFANLIYMNQRYKNDIGWDFSVGKHTFGMYSRIMGGTAEEIKTPSEPQLITSSFIQHSAYQEKAFSGVIPVQSLWQNQSNISINLFWKMNYQKWGKSGSINFETRLPSPWSNTQFGYINMEWKHKQPILKTILLIRTFAQYGGGKNPSPESALYAASANPETQFDNSIMRNWGNVAILPFQFKKSQPPVRIGIPNTLHYGGGLNLRGYQNRVIGRTSNDSVYAFFRGTSGASLNLEWQLGKLFNGLLKNKYFKISPYAFYDAGIIGWEEKNSFINSGILIGGGIGTTLNFTNLNHFINKKILNDTKPIVFRFDFPFFLNVTNPVDKGNLQFRFIMGIEKSF